jgi:hypothetical protein
VLKRALDPTSTLFRPPRYTEKEFLDQLAEIAEYPGVNISLRGDRLPNRSNGAAHGFLFEIQAGAHIKRNPGLFPGCTLVAFSRPIPSLVGGPDSDADIVMNCGGVPTYVNCKTGIAALKSVKKLGKYVSEVRAVDGVGANSSRIKFMFPEALGDVRANLPPRYKKFFDDPANAGIEFLKAPDLNPY